MAYRAPVDQIRFILAHVVPFDAVAATETYAEATPDMVDAILTEAGRMASEVLAPLNIAGDETPARLENGVLRSSPGFDKGFQAIAEGGWIGLSADPEYGGAGLPQALNMAVSEMMAGACLALQLNPLLTQGQIEALDHHASDEMKALYLPKLISGEWSGTMNLTEPQAGSDVGALRSKAEPKGDGSFAVTGQKIFITWGDSDLVENVCHLVLARLPDGAPGTKGISLFMVPKFLPDENGNPGQVNSLKVVSIEHKLGIHGSPTCVMQFDGAQGWLVGAPHAGMAAMFTMMNNARLGVGMQGVAVAEAAYQHALAYAMDRKQGKTPLGATGIIDHADVRRMLAAMKADLFTARAIGLACAVALDMARASGSAEWEARAALLTPIAKAFGTDVGNEVASAGVQIHGGMGFIEETGAAQLARDIRVTLIYEGTNGIQALDLVGRKMMDEGAEALALIAEMRASGHAALAPALDALEAATRHLVAQSPLDRAGAATAYLRAFAQVLGSYYHLQAAALDPSRAGLARFVVGRLLPRHVAFLAEASVGASDLDPFPG